jgi:hypothetical protein
MEVWDFLKEASNRDVLAFIGSGIVALAGAVLSLWKYLAQKASQTPPPKAGHMAHGSIIAGGDIRAGGSIYINQVAAAHPTPSHLAIEILHAAIADPQNRGIMIVDLIKGPTVQVSGHSFELNGSPGRSGQECKEAVYELERNGLVRNNGSRPTEWCSSVCLGMMAQGA